MDPRKKAFPLSRHGATYVAALAFVLGTVTSPSRADGDAPFKYPKPTKGTVTDDYHGTKIPDPYRALEDPDSPETRAWVEAENKVTMPYLAQIPERQAIRDSLEKYWDYEKYGIPRKRGGKYFYQRNDGLQNQYVLYTMDALDADERVLLDPNKLSKDGTVALTDYAISEDGKWMAYGLSKSGSDWKEYKIKNIKTGEDLNDTVEWIKFSGASWTKDSKGFFYSRYDEPTKGAELQQQNYYQKLYYHKINTPQSKDELVYQRPDEKEWGFGSEVTDDGRFLIINVWKGTEPKNLIFYKDLTKEDSQIVELISVFEAEFNFVDNVGEVFWFKTDFHTPRSRLLAISVENPREQKWKEIIPQVTATLQSVSSVGEKLIATYLTDAKSKVAIFSTMHPMEAAHLDGTVDLPGIGSARGFAGRRDDTETFYSFSSFADPGTIYRLDVASGEKREFRKPMLGFDPEKFETKQVFYNSKDGTRIPMFITHKKGLTFNSQNPTLLYGYGGFNISMTPRFSVSNIVWMNMGGVFAQACLRGGGEYGQEWHDAGRLLNKQNVFDDFIAAAEYLIKSKYTVTEKLAIAGGSNGGLLVGACITQRPDLFAAALPAVGVMDMLRFPKFTIGWAWTSDYGDPVKEEKHFKNLLGYSPYHNLKPGTAYPATMITTADHDDRVVPAHSFKFAARLQEMHSGAAPVMIRIETKAGHGAGKPTSKRIDEAADKWAFLAKNLKMTNVKEHLGQ